MCIRLAYENHDAALVHRNTRCENYQNQVTLSRVAVKSVQTLIPLVITNRFNLTPTALPWYKH